MGRERTRRAAVVVSRFARARRAWRLRALGQIWVRASRHNDLKLSLERRDHDPSAAAGTSAPPPAARDGAIGKTDRQRHTAVLQLASRGVRQAPEAMPKKFSKP